jgi:hypothetical protein
MGISTTRLSVLLNQDEYHQAYGAEGDINMNDRAMIHPRRKSITRYAAASSRRVRKAIGNRFSTSRAQGQVDQREVHQIEHDVRLGPLAARVSHFKKRDALLKKGRRSDVVTAEAR